MDEYAYVLIKETKNPDSVIFVHDFWLDDDESEGGRAYVLATRYSVLSQVYPFQSVLASDDGPTSEKELVLHFQDFDKMGKREDAEWLSVDGIAAARRLVMDHGEVDHVLEVPEGERSRSYLDLS